jgi:hypothetical protein
MGQSLKLSMLATCAVLVACKDSKPAPATTSSESAIAAKPGAAPEREPAADAPPAPELKPTQPITVDEARAALPPINGTQLIAPKQTSDRRQVHATWCIDGTSADDVAQQLALALGEANYTEVSVRGDARKAAVAGRRDGVRLSMVVSASAAQVCAAPAHYFASASVFKP